MRIAAIEVRSLAWAAGGAARWQALVVVGEDGSVGWAGLPPAIASRLGDGPIASLAGLVGSDARAIDAITDGLRRDGDAVAEALAGRVDVALHDRKARALGVPLHELLGGRYRERIAVGVLLDGDVADAAPPAAAERTVKVRARFDTSATAGRSVEAARVRAAVAGLAERLDGDVRLIVALDGRPPLATTLAVVSALDDLGLAWIELGDVRPEALAIVVRRSRTPVAHGAGLVGAAALRPFVERHLSPLVVVDVAANGLSEARRMTDLAAHFDALVVPADAAHPLDALAAVHHVASQPTAVEGLTLPGGTAPFAGLLADVLRFESGALVVPSGVGLGAVPPATGAVSRP